VCSTRSGGSGYPIAQNLDDTRWLFGSYHPGICQFVFGDGRVQAVRNDLDPLTLGVLTQRNDAQPVPAY
jgi:hypothetical protein